MISKLSQSELNDLLVRAQAADAERRRAETERAVTVFKGGELPTPDDVVRVVTWRVGEARQSLLRHHRFWKEQRLRAGFDALISAALAAHVDLTRAEAALTAFADSREQFEDHIDHTVGNPAQKEVMAFCAAYFGTVDTLRRIKECRQDLAEEIDATRLAATAGPVFRFMLDLRRNLSHGSVTVPGWSVTSDFKSATGAMYFDVPDLLAFATWSAEVRPFLEGAAEGRLRISTVTAECAKGLAKLRRDLHALYYRNRTPAEEDFQRLQDLHRRCSSRQWMKVLLSPHANKGTDSYPHLPRFFSKEEVRGILRRPKHSAEQVELIIALRSPQTDCDAELRAMLYKLFQVVPKDGPQGAQHGN
jgi:hypothetical protein